MYQRTAYAPEALAKIVTEAGAPSHDQTLADIGVSCERVQGLMVEPPRWAAPTPATNKPAPAAQASAVPQEHTYTDECTPALSGPRSRRRPAPVSSRSAGRKAKTTLPRRPGTRVRR